MNFGMIILTQSMETGHNFVTQILIVLSLILKPKIFLKIFLMMLIDGLMHLIIIKKDKKPLPIGKNKKVPGLFKDELGREITEFVALRAKAYSNLDDDGSELKKSKSKKKFVIKQNLMFQSFKDSMLNDATAYRSQERFKSYNNEKRIQTFDGIETYPYGTNAFKICECEMLIIKDLFFEMVLQQQ